MGRKEKWGGRIAKSLFFSRASERSEAISENPDQLDSLLKEAAEKSNDSKDGPLKEVWSSLMSMYRMLRAYVDGSYREMPFKTLLAVVSSLVYFVMPMDMVPDVFVFFGLMDDAALIAWTVKSIKNDIDRFTAWEEETWRSEPPQEA